MKCNEIRELMPDLAAGLIAATPEMKAHLDSCAECAGKLEELRQTMALLDEWQAPEPSPYFDMRLQARLREEAARQPAGWLHWLRRPALAVSLALFMVVGVYADSARADISTGPSSRSCSSNAGRPGDGGGRSAGAREES